MKIIGKVKDFYDYNVGIMGEDEKVVYDRRDAIVLNPKKDTGLYATRWFSKDVLWDDIKKQSIRYYLSKKVENQKNSSFKNVLEGKVFHFVLEIGFYHYIFEVERYLDDNDESRVYIVPTLIEKKRVEKEERIDKAPMSLCPLDYCFYRLFKTQDFKPITKEKIINPILKNTYIPNMINAEEVWSELYEYISSLNDKEITDNRTNDEHIESHGFDKKISFRHRKK